jgi:methylmalonyl-CoA mutase, C-terminal domain
MKKGNKILLAKLGLDIHNRGVLTVARNLRDAGMHVIYIGNSTISGIISSAVQEGVDIIGVSSLGGAHLSLGEKLIRSSVDSGIKDDTVFLIGGAIPDGDVIKLKDMGFDGVFTAGARANDIITEIEMLTERKRINTR